MKRILANDIKESLGEVTLQGWLHKKRKLGGLNFLLLRDRSGVAQILVKDEDEMEKLRGLQVGTVLTVHGVAETDERAPGGVEIHEPTLEVVVPVESEPPIEIDKHLSHDGDNLDTLFEHRPIGLRNLNEQAVFRLRSEMLREIRQFYYENDFVEIQTPKLLSGATEGGAEVFELDYFGQQATLAQSPQFYKQMMVGVFERVFEIGQAYRAELSATSRHMTELTMLDMEMGFIDGHQDVLDMTEAMVTQVLTNLYQQQADIIKQLRAPELQLADKFPRYTVEQIHELYEDATGDEITDKKDLTPAEERWICEYALKNDGSEAVWVTDFPATAAKFYHKLSEDGQHAVWADLLFRGVEIATVPQREHRHEVMLQQMKDAGLDVEAPGFAAYLSAFEYGLPPHGGFGFGLDRFLQLIVGLDNVKEAALFPRDLNRLAP